MNQTTTKQPNPEKQARWRVWRAILDRIIASPHYRYDDPQKWPYIRLAQFAQNMLAHYNTECWR